MNIKQSTATTILRRLELTRLISRIPEPSDRRRIWIELTDKGRSQLESAPNLLQENFQERFEKLLDGEQSHSQVDGTLELPNILALSQTLRRRQQQKAGLPYPDILAELEYDELQKFGRRYLEDTQVHRSGAPRFIDKMPNNFRHIGLIRLILPNARIIDARRDPMACCFSGFKQLFAEGQEFSYDLADLGQYYRDYVDLMEHWDQVLPGYVLRVQYEDVVADLEQQVQRILDFCGLPFEPGCLAFYRTERSVRTPSSEQVRQPIYNTGLEQWKHYESHLEPLRRALGDLDSLPRTV